MSTSKEIWETLSKVDVSSHVEKKAGLSYLSWAWAWGVLMQNFPQATYVFHDTQREDDGSATVSCTVTIDEASRTMWLPVMDNRNNAVKSPDARKISDSKMRCLVKCLAMFGLGHYIYAGEDLPQGKSDEETYQDLVMEHAASIATIKTGIANGDLSTAAEAWFTIHPDDDTRKEIMTQLWKAPSKGGCFTTAERDIIKSSDFRKAYYGETA